MNLSNTQLPPNPHFDNFLCALTTVILLSVSFWANSSQLEQSSPEIQPSTYADYVSLLNR